MRNAPVFWVNAGEVSGDIHGAALIRALLNVAPDAVFHGMGGDEMQRAGQQPDFHSRELSLVGFTEVFSSLPRIGRLLRKTWKRLKGLRPSAIILLDSPDYNFLLARMGRRLGIPVYFYISPQVWAWRTGRVHFLQKHARKILCILPFEKEFYARHGVEAEFVGHPLLDEIPFDQLDVLEPVKGRVGLLPGSRRKEIASLMPQFAEAARLLYDRRPDLTFTVMRAPGVAREEIMVHWDENVPVSITEPNVRYEAMRKAEVLIAASGTVSLETALIGTPTIVAYQLSGLTFALAKHVVRVDHISLANLILGDRVFPELLQEDATGPVIASAALDWLNHEQEILDVRNQLTHLREMMGDAGAPARAAECIMQDLQPS